MNKIIFIGIFLFLFVCACSKDSQKTLLFISTLEDNKYTELIEQGIMKAAKDYDVLLDFHKLNNTIDLTEQKNILLRELGENKLPSAIAMNYSNFDTNFFEDINIVNTNSIPFFIFNESMAGNDYISKNIKGSVYVDNSVIASVAIDKITEQLENRIHNFSQNNKAEIAVIEYVSSTNKTFVGDFFEAEFEKKITNEQAVDIENKYKINKIVLDDEAENFTFEHIFSPLINNKVFAIFFTDERIIENFLTLYSNINIDNAAKDGEKMLIIGVDSGEQQIEAIRNNFIYGSILKNPYLIGYFIVEAMVAIIEGVETPSQDITPKWYDSSNIDNSEISAILY